MLGGEHDDHDVRNAGQGKGNEGAVHDRDQEDTEDAKAEEKVQQGISSAAVNSVGGLRGCADEVVRRGVDRCEELHT